MATCMIAGLFLLTGMWAEGLKWHMFVPGSLLNNSILSRNTEHRDGRDRDSGVACLVCSTVASVATWLGNYCIIRQSDTTPSTYIYPRHLE